MGLTSLTNPGTIPAKAIGQRQPPPMNNRLPAGYASVNGVMVPLKYCHICGIIRPPRSSHCRESDRCIEKWDHFCPWVGTAVGRRNYRWFFLFLLSTMWLAISVAIGAIEHVRLVYTAQLAPAAAAASPVSSTPSAPTTPLWLRVAGSAPTSVLLLLYCGVVGLLLLFLATYHAYLIGINQTTYENVRGSYDASGPLGANPFHRGVLLNVGEVLCPSCVPPYRWEGAESGGNAIARDVEEGADAPCHANRLTEVTALSGGQTVPAKACEGEEGGAQQHPSSALPRRQRFGPPRRTLSSCEMSDLAPVAPRAPPDEPPPSPPLEPPVDDETT